MWSKPLIIDTPEVESAQTKATESEDEVLPGERFAGRGERIHGITLIRFRGFGLVVVLLLLASCNRATTVESPGLTQPGVTLKTRIHVGGPTEDILFADGSLWVNRGRDIVRIDPKKDRVAAHVAPLEGPRHTSLAAGAGSIWSTVSDYECTQKGPYPDCVQKGGAVHRIDPRSGKVQAKIAFGDRSPSSIAILDETVWVKVAPIYPDVEGVRLIPIGSEVIEPTGEPAFLARVDARTNQIVEKVSLPEELDGTMAVGEGSLWIHREYLYRLDIQTGKVVAKISAGTASDRIVFGGGSVWVGGYSDMHQLSRIDPKTNSVVAEIQTAQFADMQWGDGFLWFVDDNVIDNDQNGDKGWSSILMRFRPNDQQVDAQSEAGYTGSDSTHGQTHVETGDGSIWVTTYGYVARFDPQEMPVPRKFENCPTPDLRPRYLPAGFKEARPPKQPSISPLPPESDDPRPIQADWTLLWKKGSDRIRFRGGVIGSELYDPDAYYASDPVEVRNYEGRYYGPASPTGSAILKWSEETRCGVKDFEIAATGVSKEGLIRVARSAGSGN